ncbi:hypothetical protein CHUAL_000819 [Chamberlinius hualienensis]
MPSRDDDEFMELLPNSEKDLDNSLFDRKAAVKHVMDQQQTKPANKWLLPLMAGFLFMTLVAIGLAISLLNRRTPGEELPLVDQPNVVAVQPPLPHFHSTIHRLTSNDTNSPWESIRLPRNALPIQYQIVLHPNLTTNQFKGVCRILVNVTSPTRYFVLHSLNLNITNVKVSENTSDGRPLIVDEMFEFTENEYLILNMTGELTTGNYIIELDYIGNMAEEKLFGLYRSKYRTKGGKQKYLALTHFEPTDARRAFPCFDEPDLKAQFEMAVIHEPEHTALSNMPVVKTTDYKDGLKKTEFQLSVPMSTYLVCIVVSDFSYINSTTNDSIEVRVYAAEDQIKYAEYALNVAVVAMNFYTNFFNISYPLPKLDLIAIPDFMSGAMENWGLVTFREAALLYNEEETIDLYKEIIMTFVVHELGHMWFGNLVTMKWWDDLWLNEGFARNMEQLAGDYVDKSFREPEMFVTDNIQSVMQEDTDLHSHPIVQEVIHPYDINGIFDSISYEKGSSVIYMLDTVLGRENFKKGLIKYLQKYKFSNAVTSDLWNSLSDASDLNINVSSMMDSWTRQEGYPVITVHQNQNSWNITQDRFLFSLNKSGINNVSRSPFNFTWDVPLTYVHPANDSLQIHWLHREKQNIFKSDFAGPYPLKFNVNNTGFYRVNYEASIWHQFSDQLLKNYNVYSPTDRSNLIDDVFSLSRGGYLNYSSAFELARYLKYETDYIPWITALRHLNELLDKLEVTDVFPHFRNYSLDLITPLYERLGWSEDGDVMLRNLRISIVSSACKFGLQDCLNEASRQFQEWKNGARNVSQKLKPVIYKYGLQNSYLLEDWEYVWMKFSNVNISAQEKDILLSALACTRNPSLIYRYIEYVNDSSKVRSQDFFRALNKLTNRVSLEIVWDFIRSQWSTIVQRFSLNTAQIGSIFPKLGHMFFQENRIKEYEEFIWQYPDIGAGQRQRQFGLDIAKQNVEWSNRFKDDIKLWLSNNIQ